MKNYITENEALNTKIKNVGVLLYVSAGLTTMFAILLQDPFYIVDILIITSLAYFVYNKKSSKAIYGAGIYWILDTVLVIGELLMNPTGLIVRSAMLYYILSTGFKVYKQDGVQRLIPAPK